MSHFETSTATLRFFGDDLDPEEITSRLGCTYTRCTRKGEVTIGKVTGNERIAKTGSWLLLVSDQEPANLDLQISEILARLTDDLEVWRDLTKKYQANVFCGMFMATGNDGLALSATTLLSLGERRLEIWLDVYDHTDD